MSAVVSESVFFSTLKPNTSVTTYALPSDIQLDNGGTTSDEVSRQRRVQQQIQMRLAEKSTLPRQNGSSSHYAMSDYGGSSTMKYSTYSPNFSSKSSYMFSGSKTLGPRVAHRQDYSSRSAAPDLSQLQRMSVGGGGGFYQEDTIMGRYQGSMRQHNRMDQDAISVHSLRNVPVGNAFMVDDSDAGSLISERDGTLNSHYTQSANGFTSQMMQGGRALGQQQSMRSTVMRSGGMMGGGAEVMQHQQSFKGPAHRTISRLTSRNRTSMGSLPGNQMVSSGINFGGGDRVDGFMASTLSGSQSNLMMQRQGNMARSMSIRSMQSVGRGADIYGGPMDMGDRIANMAGFQALDMETAVLYLKETDTELQTMGAAYIQHQCYNKNEAKTEVREQGGINELVRLFNEGNIEVQRYATGAVRNLIFENMENKLALVQCGGITELVNALSETDEELRKNITGILWNLSSKDNLKQKLTDKALPELTAKILIPATLKKNDEDDDYADEDIMSPSKAEIFTNTTGCIRNLSSADDKVRSKIRETKGLVVSLVDYIKSALQKHKSEEKGTENAMCILRNLSYQLYAELPPSHMNRLTRGSGGQDKKKNEVVGCFTPHSRKAKSKINPNATTFKEVSKNPVELEWLYHPNILKVYHDVLQSCEINATTREAAIGALQNITAGDNEWASVLAVRAAGHEKMLSTLFDLLRTDRDKELRSLTGLLRNVCRHVTDKDDFARKSVKHLLDKLPTDVNDKTPGDEVVVNICGILNHLVTHTIVAAGEITRHQGLTKLMAIKNNGSTSTSKMQSAKAAATVVSNMYHYKKLRKEYAKEGFGDKSDFVDNIYI